jgi:hypothetical protein
LTWEDTSDSVINVVRSESHPSRSCASIGFRKHEAGIGRPAGMLIAAATAALVFVVGRALLPLPHESMPSTASSLPPLPSFTARIDAADQVDGIDGLDGMGGAAADGGGLALGERSLDAGRERLPTAAVENPSGTSAPQLPKSADDSAPRTATDGPQADKDIARAAWRANWPDIRAVGPRASIIIPIKGSAEGGSYRFFSKSRAIAVTLPHGASLNTMHFYRLDQEGFRALWIFQDENNAQPEEGTKLRLTLDVAAIPQVELYDDFVKITIRGPLESGGR